MDTSRQLPETVARNITAALDAGGHIPLRVAEATGIPRTTFLRLLDGHDPGFNARQLEAIGKYLHVDPIIFLKATS